MQAFLIRQFEQRKIEFAKNPPQNKNKTILVGSSWGAKGCLNIRYIFYKSTCGIRFKVIVRPHPHSLIAELDFIINEEQTTHPNVSWDGAFRL